MFLLFQGNLTKVKHTQISFANEHVAQQTSSNLHQVQLSERTVKLLRVGFYWQTIICALPTETKQVYLNTKRHWHIGRILSY